MTTTTKKRKINDLYSLHSTPDLILCQWLLFSFFHLKFIYLHFYEHPNSYNIIITSPQLLRTSYNIYIYIFFKHDYNEKCALCSYTLGLHNWKSFLRVT